MSTVFEIRCPRHSLVDERLRQAGYTVDQVRWVVNSHLHFDHAGRNAAFPEATQYVRARELEWAWEKSTKPSGILPGDLAEITADPWDYDDTFDLMPGLRLISTPGHTPGHQALLVSFIDGRSFVCAGDAAYTLQAIVDLTPTGRGTDLDQSIASLHTLTSLRAEILTAHDIDQWQHVTDADLIHSA